MGPIYPLRLVYEATLKPASVFTFAWMAGFDQVLSIVCRVVGRAEGVRELMLRAVPVAGRTLSMSGRSVSRVRR